VNGPSVKSACHIYLPIQIDQNKVNSSEKSREKITKDKQTKQKKKTKENQQLSELKPHT
jgi:hypothetical protein